MQHVTRNLLLLAVMGFTLFGYASVDARQRNRNYTVDVNRTSIYPGHSSYNIDIRDNTIYPPDVSDSYFRRNRYRSYNPNMIYVGDYAIPSVPQIFNNVAQKHRERRRLKAETELLEAQTALLRRQLQQIEDVERYKRNQRLVYGDRTKKRQSSSTKAKPSRKLSRISSSQCHIYAEQLVEKVRSGKITAYNAISHYVRQGGSAPYMRAALRMAGLYPVKSKRVQRQKEEARHIVLPSGRRVLVGN